MSAIDDWVETLAGRGTRGGESVDQEAQMLRTSLLPQADSDFTEESPDIGEVPGRAALLRRLRDEGLLGDGRAADLRPPVWLRWAGGLAVAAAVLLLALLLPWSTGPMLVPHQSADFDDTPRLRSGPGDLRQTVTADTVWLGRLVEWLGAQGLPYRLLEAGDAWRLDFYVPDESVADASTWLNAESIRIPETGWVRLEVHKER